jgi:hypothetical protein
MWPFTRISIVIVLLAFVFLWPLGATAREPSVGYPHLRKQAGHEAVFPPHYPRFLRELYLLVRERPPDNSRLLEVINQTRERVGQAAFEEFLERFGIDPENREDLALELTAQIARMRRRDAYVEFVGRFDQASSAERRELVRKSVSAAELEYALRNCEENQFETLLQLVLEKEAFGPHTPQDETLLDTLTQEYLWAREQGSQEEANRWRVVIAQLASPPVGRAEHRLSFSKEELFAMLRNAERTIEQRKHPFTDISSPIWLEGEAHSLARELIASLVSRDEMPHKDQLVAYAFFDQELAEDLDNLRQVYGDILSNRESNQAQHTRNSVQEKKQIIETMQNAPGRQVKLGDLKARQLVLALMESQNQPHRAPFIRGIILQGSSDKTLACRLIEDFPMIVAGATYPYQWKHDNEVNIALLLANMDPYYAAQAVRFIIYHSMWKSEEAKRLGFYGWLPQIIFGDRQTGKLPQFDGKTYHYFPDFRFRPTKEIDRENERNRTSEIMQLPFFGWTVWRVYEELDKVNPAHAVAFLTEVYPFVRANTEAIRTALDPYDEGVLSGRDAWVNGMDNSWYHLMVMRRHLPERLMPTRARQVVESNRVDNRTGKCPGCPEDPILLKGRPSDYYYQFKIAFYDIAEALDLDPLAVYHATPYNAKDVAITGIMARSLEAQIDMAKVLRESETDAQVISALRGQANEMVSTWEEEIGRYKTYLTRMKKMVNEHLWSQEDQFYYNRDVTQMFPGAANLFFCRPAPHPHDDVGCEPIAEYWSCEDKSKDDRGCRLKEEAYAAVRLNGAIFQIRLDSAGHVQYKSSAHPYYWQLLDTTDGEGELRLWQAVGDPFLPEQFSRPVKAPSGRLYYEPDENYWTCGPDENGTHHCQLNERAQKLLGRGARRIEDGDLLDSPGIAGFFPLFGRIPSEDQGASLALQVVNPWMWWPTNGIPIPTQPMNVCGSGSGCLPNKVYDRDRYWLGPTWMASNKPVMDGFRSYGYEMLYLYLVKRTVGTLQDGRAVEHWDPETGTVNTSNVNFPWTASCMAGSIWEELTADERSEYLRLFHPNRFTEVLEIVGR